MIAGKQIISNINILHPESRNSNSKAKLSQSENLYFLDFLSQIMFSIGIKNLNNILSFDEHNQELIDKKPKPTTENNLAAILQNKLNLSPSEFNLTEVSQESRILNISDKQQEIAKIKLIKETGAENFELSKHFPIENALIDQVVQKRKHSQIEIQQQLPQKDAKGIDKEQSQLQDKTIQTITEIKQSVNNLDQKQNFPNKEEDSRQINKIQQFEKTEQKNADYLTKQKDDKLGTGGKEELGADKNIPNNIAKTLLNSGKDEVERTHLKLNPIRFSELPTKVATIIQNSKEFPVKAELTLKPDSLGTIVVEIKVVKGEIEIMFKADNKETMQLIESQVNVLKEKLNNLGFERQNFVFQHQLNENENNFFGNQRKQGKHDEESLRREFLNSFSNLRNQKESFDENIWGENDNQH
ncbi:MAG: flagellar hook-length control protein FliK [Candidatus Kapaibacteriota bacterium]|jgi:flagellar hook-length control protein FliK